jgi:hypothetical protein
LALVDCAIFNLDYFIGMAVCPALASIQAGLCVVGNLPVSELDPGGIDDFL